MNFLRQGFRKLASDRQTDKQNKPEMDMGWVHPWVWLGRVGSNFRARNDGLGGVG